MISRITDNLYIGTIRDAIHDSTDWGLIINVCEYETLSPDEWHDLMCQNRTVIHAPFMKYEEGYPDNGVEYADLTSLNKIASIIEANLYSLNTTPILVHCGAGRERSPLAVVWFCHVKADMTLDEAYDLVRAKRPIVEDRRSWLFKSKE